MKKHSEAFALMKYRADDGTEEEIIWNSRDGVTPFVITLRSGKAATHVDWTHDIYAPNYTPKLGERIFVDLTPQAAEVYAKRTAAKYWPNNDWGCHEIYKTEEAMVQELVTEYLEKPIGAPDLIEVTERWLENQSKARVEKAKKALDKLKTEIERSRLELQDEIERSRHE